MKDEFILNYVQGIPILNLQEKNETKEGLIYTLSYYFGGVLGVYTWEHKKRDQAYTTLKDISGKYASAEFMLKNYFQGLK